MKNISRIVVFYAAVRIERLRDRLAVQAVGLEQLLLCYRDQTCLRQFLASIILLGYNLFLTHHTGQGASSDTAPPLLSSDRSAEGGAPSDAR